MSKVDYDSYRNDWYVPMIGASKFKQILWYFVNVFFFINPANPFSGIKCLLLKWFGARMGRAVVIKPGVNIKYPWKLVAGDNTWIGEHVWIDNLATVTIGNNVCISQGTMLLTGNHNYKKATFDLIVKEIILEDGVWLGARSVVCPGVTARSHSVLTVGSIATKSMDGYMIYSGNPAIGIKQRIIQ